MLPGTYTACVKVVDVFGAGVDVLIYSEDDIEEHNAWCISPVYWALRESKVLYE